MPPSGSRSLPLRVVEIARHAVNCNVCFESGRLLRPLLAVAQPRWIGPAYATARLKVAIIGLNPGQGSAAHAEANREALRLLTTFARTGEGLGEALMHQRLDMPNWGRPAGRFARFYFTGLGLDPNEVALLNIAWCATVANAYPASMLAACYDAHTGPLVESLSPDVVIFSGAETHAYAHRVSNALPRARCTQALHFAHRKGDAANRAELVRLRALLQEAMDLAPIPDAARIEGDLTHTGMQMEPKAASIPCELALDPVFGGAARVDPSEGASYCLGKPVSRAMRPHNEVTFERLRSLILETGEASYAALVRAATGHVAGDKGRPRPEHFVDYCIKRKWLQRC